MIVVTKDRIAECNELKLDGNIILAYVSGCQGCCFDALICKTEEEAEDIFESITAHVVNENTKKMIIDFTYYK